MVKELDKAIQYMSKRRIGALITIQKNTGLEDYIETGIPLDADISGELLINIFIPNYYRISVKSFSSIDGHGFFSHNDSKHTEFSRHC